MICFSSKLPVLQVGTHQLKDYDTSCLLRAIMSGLREIEIEDETMAQDIYAGVLYYLENDCPWKPLKIESLYERIDKVFHTIGFSQVAGKLPMYAPEVRISVREQLESLDCQIEMMLFQTIQAEIDALKPYGVEKVILEDVIEAVHTLIPSKKWTKQCQALHDELLSLQESYHTPYERELTVSTPRS